MTTEQLRVLAELLLITKPPVELYFGDCIGSDETAFKLASALGFHTIALPPINKSRRASCPADEVWEPMEYLARNRVIAQESDYLIATPESPKRPRSGTWATVSYARELKKTAIVIMPDGTVQFEK